MNVTLKSCFPRVVFGTSGIRALVADLTPEVVAAYVFAFVSRLENTDDLTKEKPILIGMDLRPSSPDIVKIIDRSLKQLGYKVHFLGILPTPALALKCMSLNAPGMMVTGSHIPFDRNGIKFYSSKGEILKEDEQAISEMFINALPFDAQGGSMQLPKISHDASQLYLQRYVNFFGTSALSGLRVGVYEHSSAGRDIMKQILLNLGAMVFSLGRIGAFVPIDTEALSDEHLKQARNWCKEHRLDALISADGDGDRPLVFDADGQFIRGDLLGLLCATALNIKTLVVPVNCNTAIEKSGRFCRVLRTRIGSPYVIEQINQLVASGLHPVAGFEANGGFILGSSLPNLCALPTRDAMLPIIAILVLCASRHQPISSLFSDLPQRFTYSHRITNIPASMSQLLMSKLSQEESFRKALLENLGVVVNIQTIDGIQLFLTNGEIVHLRASGNAPELRCYSESVSLRRSKSLCNKILKRIVSMMNIEL